jgi:hypothetical protein
MVLPTIVASVLAFAPSPRAPIGAAVASRPIRAAFQPVSPLATSGPEVTIEVPPIDVPRTVAFGGSAGMIAAICHPVLRNPVTVAALVAFTMSSSWHLEIVRGPLRVLASVDRKVNALRCQLMGEMRSFAAELPLYGAPRTPMTDAKEPARPRQDKHRTRAFLAQQVRQGGLSAACRAAAPPRKLSWEKRVELAPLLVVL